MSTARAARRRRRSVSADGRSRDGLASIVPNLSGAGWYGSGAVMARPALLVADMWVALLYRC